MFGYNLVYNRKPVIKILEVVVEKKTIKDDSTKKIE